MANGIINGTKFLVYLDNGSPHQIGFSTSCSLSITQETRDTTTNATGQWITRTIGNKDWEVSCEGLFAFSTINASGNQNTTGLLTQTIFQNYLDDTSGSYNPRFELNFSAMTGASEHYYKGYACLTSLTIDAPMEESATFSATFIAAGPLEIVTT